jgi:hypothetical protein
MTAAQALNAALVDLADTGRTTPCQQRDNGDLWLSDDADDREASGHHCRRCPVIAKCLAYSREIRPPLKFGVFGGFDFTPLPRKAKAA